MRSTQRDSNSKNEGILIFIQIELEVLLRHREDCYSQELIFVGHNETSCDVRTRCQGKTLIEKEDSTVCLVNNVCASVCGWGYAWQRAISSIYRVVKFFVNGIEVEELSGIPYVWEEIHSQMKVKWKFHHQFWVGGIYLMELTHR